MTHDRAVCNHPDTNRTKNKCFKKTMKWDNSKCSKCSKCSYTMTPKDESASSNPKEVDDMLTTIHVARCVQGSERAGAGLPFALVSLSPPVSLGRFYYVRVACGTRKALASLNTAPTGPLNCTTPRVVLERREYTASTRLDGSPLKAWIVADEHRRGKGALATGCQDGVCIHCSGKVA